MRASRGPRQPGGGRQRAGSRHGAASRHSKRFAQRHPEPRAERRAKSAAADPAFRKLKSGKPEFGHGPKSAGRSSFEARPQRASQNDEEQKIAPASMPTTVQNVAVTADEAGMRVDRFFEARFPGLSFSHIQRVIRKGEVRVNGKRTEPKNRLEAGQTVRIPPLRLDQPKPRTPGSEADEKTREFVTTSPCSSARGRRRTPSPRWPSRSWPRSGSRSRWTRRTTAP